MKRLHLLFFFALSLFFVACNSGESEGEEGSENSEESSTESDSNATSQDEAIAWNDELVDLDQAAYDALINYESAIYNGSMDTINMMAAEVESRIADGMMFLENSDERFDGSFKDAGMGMFEAYVISYEEYMPIMIEYWTSPYEELTDEMEMAEQEAYDAMWAEIEEKSDLFIVTQEEFAKEYNFILE